MNRRKFCTGLALTPAAAIAVTVGVKVAPVPVIHAGNTSMRVGCLVPGSVVSYGHAVQPWPGLTYRTVSGSTLNFGKIKNVRFTKDRAVYEPQKRATVS